MVILPLKYFMAESEISIALRCLKVLRISAMNKIIKQLDVNDETKAVIIIKVIFIEN